MIQGPHPITAATLAIMFGLAALAIEDHAVRHVGVEQT